MSTAPDPSAFAPSLAASDLAQALHEAFQALPLAVQARCRVPPTGDARLDRPITVHAGDYSDRYDGIIVSGERDEDGQWLLDTAFVLLTLDAEGPTAILITVLGWNCDVEPA